ncbi:hypothetical protein [Desulfobotulus alkaliphilus]|nr:hypothetical protein [Desulfobotulus alkaliphilus]
MLDLFHYLHEKNRHLIPRVDAVIKEMKQNGELDILIKKAEEKVLHQFR